MCYAPRISTHLHAIRIRPHPSARFFSGFLETLFGICHILGCIAHVEDQLASIQAQLCWSANWIQKAPINCKCMGLHTCPKCLLFPSVLDSRLQTLVDCSWMKGAVCSQLWSPYMKQVTALATTCLHSDFPTSPSALELLPS